MAASRTALYVALYRALEHRERARPQLFDDPFAAAFLPPSYRLLVEATRLPPLHGWLSRYADRRAPGARSSAIARTRLIDDVVRRHAAEGVSQIVVLGAGFDSRAHRMRELAGATVFEVDRPETQRQKTAVLAGRSSIARVCYVAVDFLRDDVGTALAGAGWDRGAGTLFVWEGVTNYLTSEAVEAVLAWIASTSGRAGLVFTYIHAGLLDGSVAFEGGARILANVRTLGEPWTFGLRPSEVGPFLARHGLVLEEDLGADEYRERYLPRELHGFGGYAFYRLAVATKPLPTT